MLRQGNTGSESEKTAILILPSGSVTIVVVRTVEGHGSCREVAKYSKYDKLVALKKNKVLGTYCLICSCVYNNTMIRELRDQGHR